MSGITYETCLSLSILHENIYKEEKATHPEYQFLIKFLLDESEKHCSNQQIYKILRKVISFIIYLNSIGHWITVESTHEDRRTKIKTKMVRSIISFSDIGYTIPIKKLEMFKPLNCLLKRTFCRPKDLSSIYEIQVYWNSQYNFLPADHDLSLIPKKYLPLTPYTDVFKKLYRSTYKRKAKIAANNKIKIGQKKSSKS